MTKPRYTPLLIVLDALSILLIFLTFMYVFAVWPELPDQLPTHYNFAGEVDGWSGRSSIWLLPVLSAVIFATTSLSMFFPKYINLPVRITDENRRRVIHEALLMMGFLKLIMIAMFSAITFFTARLANLPSWLMFVFLGLLFLDVVLFFVRVKRAARQQPEARHVIY